MVSYDVDGAREVVRTGETGYLLPPCSVDPMAAALITLVESQELRQRLGQTGRERFTEQFRHQTMASRLRSLYQQLLPAGTASSVANT